MCLVQTPYYHDCGHYGNSAVAPYGRCARAEGIPGACWESKPIGIKTVEAMCGSCTRMAKDAIIKDNNLGTGPVDINKFNQLVKLHKKTCDRRASIASDSSHHTYNAFLPTAEELALRRPSAASEISTASTSASTMSTKGRPPILVINPPQHLSPFSAPAWNSVPDQKNHGKKPACEECTSPKSR